MSRTSATPLLAALSLLVRPAASLRLPTPANPISSPIRSFATGEPPVLIDLRSAAAFASGHLAGATSLPVSALRERLYELPPPGEWPLTILGDARELAEARALLSPKGWTFVEAIDAERADTWSGADVETGGVSAPSWRPNSFLAAVLREIEPPRGEAAVAVDVGCGSGRDAVAMALRLGGSWRVYGVDNHDGALQRGRALSRESGAGVDFVNLELRKPPALDELAGLGGGAPLRLLHGCRFLHRPLLEAAPSLLAAGGLVVYSHFEDPSDGPPLAPPYRPGRRLQRGELRALLGEERGFDVLCDAQGEMLTRGVWVPAQFYAARRRDDAS